jgi:hypothetical protein
MRRNVPWRGSVGVQQTGGGAVRGIALIACQRTLDRVADDRVNEERGIICSQHLCANKGCNQ